MIHNSDYLMSTPRINTLAILWRTIDTRPTDDLRLSYPVTQYEEHPLAPFPCAQKAKTRRTCISGSTPDYDDFRLLKEQNATRDK